MNLYQRSKLFERVFIFYFFHIAVSFLSLHPHLLQISRALHETIHTRTRRESQNHAGTLRLIVHLWLTRQWSHTMRLFLTPLSDNDNSKIENAMSHFIFTEFSFLNERRIFWIFKTIYFNFAFIVINFLPSWQEIMVYVSIVNLLKCWYESSRKTIPEIEHSFD